MREGKQLFSSSGLKKTTVDDLVKAAGIAKGSFYKFYPSKEMLYMEIIESEERTLREGLSLDLLDGGNLNKETIRTFFLSFIDFLETEPLFLKMFSENALEQLLIKLPEEKVQEHMNRDEEWSDSLIRSWQASGYLAEMEPDVFAALMRSIFILFTQKKVIGEEQFQGALGFIFDAMAHQIIATRRLP